MNSLPILSRRQFVQVGGLGLMLGLPELLRADLGQRETERSCIFIMQQGGPSHIDTVDLKPNAPAEIRGPYKPITTSVPGIQVCELLPRMARLADCYCILRSLTHGEFNHPQGIHAFLSGTSRPPADAPYFGSMLSKVRPPSRPVPAYVWLTDMFDSGPRYLTGGFLGAAHAPLRIKDDPSAPAFQVTAFDPPTGMRPEQLTGRQRLLDRLDQPSSGVAERFRGLQDRALELVTSDRARRAFSLSDEPDRVRQRYGPNVLGQNLLLARRLIEAGVRLVSLHAWTGVPPGYKKTQTNNWDMHGGDSIPGDPGIFGGGTHGLGWCLPVLDQGVSALLEDLAQRGLLDSTLVVLAGEFGRAPKIDTKGVPGRNHWPPCFSAVLAGAGVRGGAVYGASDRTGGYVKDRPVTLEDFSATLLHAMGVPPETRLSPDGFTRPASTGQPIMALFG